MPDLLDAAEALTRALRAGTDHTTELATAEAAVKHARAVEELDQIAAEEQRIADRAAALKARAQELRQVAGRRRKRG